MKKYIFLLIACLGASAFADNVLLLDTRLNTGSFRAQTSVDTKFYMDTRTGQGYADIEVNVTDYLRDPFPPRVYCDRWGRCYPQRHFPRIPRTREIYDQRIKINNLKLVGDQMIYYGTEGRVNCGRLGQSRVLRVPTLYLTGNCKLKERLRRNRLKVNFIAR